MLLAARLRGLRAELFGLVLLLAIFTWFTWRGMTMFYSGDDMMNMYGAWDLNPWRLAQAQLIIWIPVARPVGAAVYRLFYAAFGFNPEPLYIFCWLLLAANVIVGYRFLRTVTSSATEALIALSFVLVHGSYGDLYYSAGTIYDRLCFLFTTAGLIVYFQFRRKPSGNLFALICLLAIFAMGSKESGVALLPLMFCCECIFFLPEFWQTRDVRGWLRQTAPLFGTLTILAIVFLFGRVKRTPELLMPDYQPNVDLGTWLVHVGEYFGILTYHQLSFSVTTASILLGLMLAAALVSRNRAMLFGWLFFVITITPVALISSRPGYVLYVPSLGLGLFLAGLVSLLLKPVTRVLPQMPAIAFIAITVAITWVNVRNWPPAWNPLANPQLRLTEQFRQTYPTLPPKTKLLFVSDEFPPIAYDLMFNIRLLYHDKSIVVHRLNGNSGLKPNPKHPLIYDHIFASESGRYVEIDPRNQAESIRLNILRDYQVGTEMDMTRRDHSAYVVSGLLDVDTRDPFRWTGPRAEFKFKVRAAPLVFSAKFYVPEFVAKSAAGTLSILVNGKAIGKVVLNREGIQSVTFPAAANLIRDDTFTLVDMNVDHPYKDAKGVEYGVVLVRAGFEYEWAPVKS